MLLRVTSRLEPDVHPILDVTYQTSSCDFYLGIPHVFDSTAGNTYTPKVRIVEHGAGLQELDIPFYAKLMTDTGDTLQEVYAESTLYTGVGLSRFDNLEKIIDICGKKIYWWPSKLTYADIISMVCYYDLLPPVFTKNTYKTVYYYKSGNELGTIQYVSDMFPGVVRKTYATNGMIIQDEPFEGQIHPDSTKVFINGYQMQLLEKTMTFTQLITLMLDNGSTSYLEERICYGYFETDLPIVDLKRTDPPVEIKQGMWFSIQ